MVPEPLPPPPPPPPPRPILIRRKKAGRAGHNSGAWKVAYADFVTAMMALFIVLWLMNSDEQVKKAVSAFFNNPNGDGTQIGTAAPGTGHSVEIAKDDMGRLAEKLQQALLSIPKFQEFKDHVEITVTSDGLRVELLETDAGMFFDSGRAHPTEAGAALLSRLAEELGKLPNTLLIEGHTDAKPFSRDDVYSNWELSADRANAARRLMVTHGVRDQQIAQVRGFAARQLKHPDDANAASNRRVSVIVQYLPRSAADMANLGTGQPAAIPTYTRESESPRSRPSVPVAGGKSPSSTAETPSFRDSPRE